MTHGSSTEKLLGIYLLNLAEIQQFLKRTEKETSKAFPEKRP
jgi:hypothetical protein